MFGYIMVKKTTTLTIENEIIEKAKKMGMNMSDVAEKAIAKETGEVTFNTNEGTNCEFCNREDTKATADSPDLGLMWFWPDLKWICQSCLKAKSVNVPVAGGVHV